MAWQTVYRRLYRCVNTPRGMLAGRTEANAEVSVDLHVDTLMAVVHEGRHLDRLEDDGAGRGLPPRQLDVPKMVAGGLDAAVFSIFVTPYWQGQSAAVRAHWLIDALDAELRREPVRDRLRRLATTNDLERATRENVRGVFIGIEGGHAIADSLERLREFAQRGIRYMTLTWANANGWADSSGSPPVHGGLTGFGRRVVREMERLGVLVDISHVADTTFRHTLACATAPVIASHSGCRAVFAHPRNLTDEQLRAVAGTGGVIGIPFFSDFLRLQPPGSSWTAPWRSGGSFSDPAGAERSDRRSRPQDAVAPAPMRGLVNHFLHALDVVGPDHVAIGSDYDGMIVPPLGLEDVSRLPVLRAALAQAGIGSDVLDAIWGGNALRVLREAEPRMPGPGTPASA
jgi:membrane dipeptidase